VEIMTAAMQENNVGLAFHGRACKGEHYSGDLAFIRELDTVTFLAIVDAAGHGRSAYTVVLEVEKILTETDVRDLMALISRLHERLKGGPGAVVIAGYLNRENLEFTYVRIDDSHGRIFGARGRSLQGQAGMLGHAIPTPEIFCDTLGRGDVLVVCTDGIAERFDLANIPGSLTASASDLAPRIVEKYGKGHDDATCLVVSC
jgi:phosphoserine phosphatase RsbX